MRLSPHECSQLVLNLIAAKSVKRIEWLCWRHERGRLQFFSELDPMDQEPIIIGGPLFLPEVLGTNCVLSVPPEIEDIERSSPADIGVVMGGAVIALGVGVCALVWLVFMLVL